MKRNSLWLLIFLLSATSCQQIYFDRMPGDRLQQIPKELTGKYQSYDWKKINGIMKRDSNGMVTVKVGSIILHTERAETYNLCDTFTFSKYKDYYFISERVAPDYWTCYILQKTQKGFVGMPVILTDEKSDTALLFLKKYFPWMEYTVFVDDTSKRVYYTKTNEEEIIHYFTAISKSKGYTEYIRK